MEAKQHIEESHGNLHEVVDAYLPNAMTISVVSLSKRMAGQMILHHPDYDKRLVAERLRMCADVLDGDQQQDDAGLPTAADVRGILSDQQSTSDKS